MGAAVKLVPPSVARNTFATLMLPALGSDDSLGEIRLHYHQRDGIERIVRALTMFRGALLCDEVGLGKTFTAAGVMRRFESSVVVAPAALIPMWEDALQRARIESSTLSIERFSKGIMPSSGAQLVVVDEAHHFRNVRTQRFKALSHFIGRSSVLLMTATPVHNQRADIVALLSLFLGSRANALTANEFADCVIRREKRIVGLHSFPSRVRFPPETAPSSQAIRQAILALPPPIPPSDGDECAMLVQFTLLRQWASSDAALRAGLESRIAKARALAHALEAGTYPTRKELESWLTGGMDVQLGFPEFLASEGGATELLAAVRKHEAESLKLYQLVLSEAAADEWRGGYLRRLRALYPDRKIIAFTQFASTARHLFRLLRNDPAVALITAARCEIASGPVPRDFVIGRFAPIANRIKRPPVREDITLLVATDLCSEGLNLQDATVLVHLDTPWTPARIEQRVGRIARPGGPSTEVFVHSITVPAISEDILRMGERLRSKSNAAAEVVGRDLLTDPSGTNRLSIPEANEAIIRKLVHWKSDSGPAVTDIVAHVRAAMDCFISVVTDGHNVSIVGGCDEQVSSDPRDIIAFIDAVSDESIPVNNAETSQILDRIDRWLQQKALEDALGVRPAASPGRRRIARQIGSATSRLPRHLRVNASALVDAARRTIPLDYCAADEERMTGIDPSLMTGEAWLHELVELGEAMRDKKAESSAGSGLVVLALLVGVSAKRLSDARSS